MDTAVSMQTWLERSRTHLESLSDVAGGAARQGALEIPSGGAATDGNPMQSLRQWIETNPCPDPKLADRLNLMVARFGYLELTSVEDRKALDNEERAALTKRFWESLDDVVGRLAELEQFGTGHKADRAES